MVLRVFVAFSVVFSVFHGCLSTVIGVDVCVFEDSYILFGCEDSLDLCEIVLFALFSTFACFSLILACFLALFLVFCGMLFAKLLELRLLLSGEVEAFEGIALALCTFAGFVAGCFGARGGCLSGLLSERGE